MTSENDTQELGGRRRSQRTTDTDTYYNRVVSCSKVSESEAGLAAGMHSSHGENASRRRALLDLLFFCGAGDVTRAQEIVETWRIDVKDDKSCDYDRRYPLHLAASEGCYRVVDWLIKAGADVNVVDRFKHTPLEDAVRGDHAEVAKLLMQAGAMVLHNGRLVALDESGYACYVEMYKGNFEADMEWEVDPDSLVLETAVGHGEFGTVYKAKWHDSTVAVKVLNNSSELAQGELRSELSTLRKTHHPHTMQCLGAVTSKKPFMIITEYMPMGSVADILEKSINLGLQRFAELALHTARGMAYLHQRQPSCVIHRDLKPANIMIGSSPYVEGKHRRQILFSQGVAKIADFGLCKTIPIEVRIDKAKAAGLTTLDENGLAQPEPSQKGTGPSYKMTGETGSYRYMAPEVFRHEPYNRKVDVYSFAMICYYLFTGMPPMFEYSAVRAAQLAALRGVRPMWPEPNRWGSKVPESVKRLVERCWSADPESRPEFSEICSELRQILPTLPAAKAPDGPGCGCSIQ
uniref:Kinase-like protein n=1 Tax=Tetraselmis sp. GSL018 TaxID=582737 RepID=A0A061RE69_9CHLO|mmetsp:Transcript_40184/g.95476  ORF Transcript_40184/g.95476 Transcript_40184/m.95476 type:complete len:519 (-) Transcript_40184:212-1768(-)|eukprot:CAMPEP_0177585532 /NCGR_PEP_ID=MMETSP0419_2-20121207/4546_1 /TAXON_ID=582737 /ORGANISM="Tetraselmis sp., Strain GSL018" /LENGTH=518 /DNA_ID=CAMNT_0019075277 /DNA_START=216 /DNA_END=1772 /DNA_ORIENTATION=+